MGMTYNFDNLTDLAEFFEQLAANKRTAQEQAKTQKAIAELGREALDFEYVATVIRKSNLIRGRIILVDDDLELARDELARTRETIYQTIETLQSVCEDVSLREKELGGE